MKNNKFNPNIFTTPTPLKSLLTQLPEYKFLYPNLWREGEIACLLGDQGVGKSVFAIQIAERVARENPDMPVVYFDFKMSAVDFARRYSNAVSGKHFDFPDNLLRCELDYAAENFNDVANIISVIEQQCKALNARVLIVDSLTWINTIALKSGAALRFMTMLYLLARKLHLSVLVVADSSKDHSRLPYTIKSLRGYRRLAPFFDTIFAIGISTKGDKHRYIKQIKTGDRDMTLTDDHVAEFVIEQNDDAFVNFRFKAYTTQAEVLPPKRQRRQAHDQIKKSA